MTTIPAERPRVGWPTKLAYGFGSIASAIKLRGLTAFLLIYYNQVIGLEAVVVSTIMMIALIFDAIIDPTIGQISDNFRSKWGRRHPFMLVSALPYALLFFLIWNPPAWSDGALAAYLLVCLLSIRFFDTFFELPAQSLGPELVTDYDQRTTLMSIRAGFGVIGGLGMTLAAYNIFMKERPDGSGGILAREGYFEYSIVAAIIIVVAILVCTLGTARQIPWLRTPPDRQLTPKVMISEIFGTLNNRAFFVIVAASMLAAVAGGVASGLELYWSLYFFELSQAQISGITTLQVVAAVTGLALAPLLARWLGKKQAGLTLFVIGLTCGIAPVSLRLLGLLPPNGDPALFTYLLFNQSILGALVSMVGVLLASMMADVVEDAEVRTGRRSEGLLFSANTLFSKMISGVGVFASGVMLTLAHFPTNSQRGMVPQETLNALGLLYVPTVTVLYSICIVVLLFFPINRKIHEENLRRIQVSATPAE
jgi:GPH family glycoside/pentoside/hexuronide:cation symporter